jgi:hypothetical protein
MNFLLKKQKEPSACIFLIDKKSNQSNKHIANSIQKNIERKMTLSKKQTN